MTLPSDLPHGYRSAFQTATEFVKWAQKELKWNLDVITKDRKSYGEEDVVAFILYNPARFNTEELTDYLDVSLYKIEDVKQKELS